jgi:hypothetical protein
MIVHDIHEKPPATVDSPVVSVSSSTSAVSSQDSAVIPSVSAVTSPTSAGISPVGIVGSPDMVGPQIAVGGSPPVAPALMSRNEWVAATGKTLFGKTGRSTELGRVDDRLGDYDGAKLHYVTKSAEFGALRDEYAALTSALSGPGGQVAAQILDRFNTRRMETLARAGSEVQAAFEATTKAFNEVDKSLTAWQKRNSSRGAAAQESLQNMLKAGRSALADGNSYFRQETAPPAYTSVVPTDNPGRVPPGVGRPPDTLQQRPPGTPQQRPVQWRQHPTNASTETVANNNTPRRPNSIRIR